MKKYNHVRLVLAVLAASRIEDASSNALEIKTRVYNRKSPFQVTSRSCRTNEWAEKPEGGANDGDSIGARLTNETIPRTRDDRPKFTGTLATRETLISAATKKSPSSRIQQSEEEKASQKVLGGLLFGYKLEQAISSAMWLVLGLWTLLNLFGYTFFRGESGFIEFGTMEESNFQQEIVRSMKDASNSKR